MLRSTLLSLAAAGMALLPVAASAAQTNPAASLSLAGTSRGHTSAAKGSDLFGGGAAGIYAIVILAGIIAIGVIAITNDDNSKSP